ncbi:MAG: aldo/keto reductase [Pontibacterium sp.]
MKTRTLNGVECASIGLGCMSLSHAYGTPPSKAYAQTLLNEALDMGYSHLDTAALYGFGANETLIGEVLKARRDEYFLASKCGMFKNDAGVREINGHPEMIRKTCEDSLKRLQTDRIDLYYLHRWDKNVPIEDSVGELSRLVEEGKILSIGLSEVSAETLRKAHAVHPIAALQTEYSLWTRNPEIAVLDACKDLGTTFVAFSPVARGFLTDVFKAYDELEDKDIRRNMPRFYPENAQANLDLRQQVIEIANKENCSLAQLSLAWLLGRGEHILPIPGTTNIHHLRENFAAMDVQLSDASYQKLDLIINQQTVQGTRYNAATQKEIDTEEF